MAESLKFQPVEKNQNYLIDFSQLEINKEKLLGTGSFGEVYEATYFKLPVAVKHLKTGHNPKALEDFQNEMQTLMYVNIKNKDKLNKDVKAFTYCKLFWVFST